MPVAAADLIVFRPSVDADARFLGYATDCQAASKQNITTWVVG